MTPAPAPSERLIVALDFDTAGEANDLVKRLGDNVGFYKVGWQLFLGQGWPFIDSLLQQGKRVFLDLKISDIEATVRAALANMPSSGGGLELITIHGNGATVKAARAGRNGHDKPKILMLTALSSWDEYDVRDVLSNDNATLQDYVLSRAERALDAGADGLIASGASVRQIRDQFKGREFLIVAPGIRPSGTAHDDHKRTLTPHEAIRDGADYLVVGRPITRAAQPEQAARTIIREIAEALSAQQ